MQRGGIKVNHDSHRLIVHLFEQIIDIIKDVIRAHRTDNSFDGLCPRKAVKLLGSVDARELED